MNTKHVVLTKRAQKDLQKLPKYIVNKFKLWVEMVETEGILEARKIKAFNDEPLKGLRKGQRSIRLNKAYRAIYRQITKNEIELIEVQEVNKHDY